MATLNICEDIYFSDGSIVLDVVEANQVMRFRVHKSVLSRNSRFFADLFGIPQPSESPSEMVEGCPAITLTGDSIDDWITIFGSLYNVFFNRNQLPTSTIIAMLRLGRKYQFRDLEQDAQSRLRQWYPSTLPEFRSRGQCPFKLKHPYELLRIAEDGIIPDNVLPALYYEHLPILDKFDDPGTENTMALVDEKIYLRLFIGHRRLLILQQKHTFACMHSFKPACITANSCKKVAKAAQNFLQALDPSGNVAINPFITLEALKAQKISFCVTCGTFISTGLEAGGTEVWRLLPWVFGLGSWEKLGTEAQDEEGDGQPNETADN